MQLNDCFYYPEHFLTLRSEYGRNVGHEVFDSLLKGRAILQTQDQLDQFLFSYGRMHHAKIKKALNPVFQDLERDNWQSVEIFDYGCGQGLASIVLLNEMQARNYPIECIEKITLIDASRASLARAEIFLSNSAILNVVHKYLDLVSYNDLIANGESVKIHLFSNIIDMGDRDFNLYRLVNNLDQSLSGVNYFVCASPLNEEKLEQFQSYMDADEELYACYEDIDSWKSKLRVFKKEI